MDIISTYALQEYIPEEVKPLYASGQQPNPIPKTILFASPDMLQSKTRNLILSASGQSILAGSPQNPYFWGYVNEQGQIIKTNQPHFSLEVPGEIVAALRLVEGDKVDLMIKREDKLVVIFRVNDHVDMRKVVSWPDIRRLEAEYPFRHLPIESFGLPTLRAATLLAPVGYGSNLFVIAPGNVGKTALLVDLWESVIRLTEVNQNLFVIGCVIGERQKDLTLYKSGLDLTRPGRVELYDASATLPPANQYEVFQFALRRARRLAGRYDVVLVLDSLSRAVAAHSFGGFADRTGDMISGGIFTESMLTVSREVSVTGDFSRNGDKHGFGSLTIASALLSGSGKGGSALQQFAVEAGDNVPDAVWTLLPNPMLGYPRLSLHELETATRRTGLFTSGAQLTELRTVHDMVWGVQGGRPTRRAEEAHAMLLNYASEHPIPTWL